MIEIPRYSRSLFIDSSDFSKIQRWNRTGVVDGVTSNQVIVLKDGIKPENFDHVVKEICREMGDKPVSVELTDSSLPMKDMIEQAKRLHDLAGNVVVKVPQIPDTVKGLDVAHELVNLGIAVNLTAIMTFEQMVMAALAVRSCKQISYISLFWSRSLEDHERYRSKIAKITEAERQELNFYPPEELGPESWINLHPRIITQEIARFLQEGGYSNIRTIIGSIRNASMVGEAITSGANIVTVTPSVLKAMLFSQRGVETVKEFDQAWEELQANGQSEFNILESRLV